MEKYESERIRVYIKDKIAFVEIIAEKIDNKIAHEGIEARLNLSNGNCYPLISDIRNVKNTTREARQILANKKAQIGVTACAVITSSMVQQIMFNFFLAIYGTIAPIQTKLFLEKEKALAWIEQYKEI